ncbi:phosphotransferase family protein [Chelatococcus reniformis]|uniref:phosphotransferase family protein n=1 Tax=Chelatococcus reniformis TaxID=1494448 RepID=UPI00166F529D|nr:phosphotransferase [Chelatococcus reniformis]
MTPHPAPAPQRLSRALTAARHFAGLDPAVGPAVPAISMPMHMGLDALSCVVTAPGAASAVFAKAFHAGALDPFTFAGAAEAAGRAGAAAVAPRLLEADAQQQVLLFEPAPDGVRMALARDAQKPAVKAAIVAAKKRWHRQPLLTCDLSPFELARDYAARLEPHLAPGSATALPYKGTVPFAGLTEWIGRIGAALSAAGVDRTPLHGENTVSNVLLDPGGAILLVDFDRAVNADPLYDLGALSLDLCRTEEERMELVEMYDGRPDAALLARLKLYAIVDDFLWGCWALLAELNPAMNGPEFFKYASNRFLRASHNLGAFDVALLVGKI